MRKKKHLKLPRWRLFVWVWGDGQGFDSPSWLKNHLLAHRRLVTGLIFCWFCQSTLSYLVFFILQSRYNVFFKLLKTACRAFISTIWLYKLTKSTKISPVPGRLCTNAVHCLFLNKMEDSVSCRLSVLLKNKINKAIIIVTTICLLNLKTVFCAKKNICSTCIYSLETIQCRNMPSSPEVPSLLLRNVPK